MHVCKGEKTMKHKYEFPCYIGNINANSESTFAKYYRHHGHSGDTLSCSSTMTYKTLHTFSKETSFYINHSLKQNFNQNTVLTRMNWDYFPHINKTKCSSKTLGTFSTFVSSAEAEIQDNSEEPIYTPPSDVILSFNRDFKHTHALSATKNWQKAFLPSSF